MFFRTAYVSRSAVRGLSAELIDIARVALARNARQDITGVLYFDRAHFFQVLEGPEAEVRRLVADIARDPRHHDMRVLEETAASQRMFPDWAMKFIDGDSDPEIRARFARLQADGGFMKTLAAA